MTVTVRAAGGSGCGFSVRTLVRVPPGSGQRIGIDRDGDGFLDGDERDAHSDPADAASTPVN